MRIPTKRGLELPYADLLELQTVRYPQDGRYAVQRTSPRRLHRLAAGAATTAETG